MEGTAAWYFGDEKALQELPKGYTKRQSISGTIGNPQEL